MQILNKNILYYGDHKYDKAVNYSQSFFNFPITLNYGEKHNRTKYIIGAGTSDHITLFKYGIFIYVISENNGLSYLSLQVINTELKEIESDIFLDSSSLDSEDIENLINLSPEEQLKQLFHYL
jgi:hypothetical protein